MMATDVQSKVEKLATIANATKCEHPDARYQYGHSFSKLCSKCALRAFQTMTIQSEITAPPVVAGDYCPECSVSLDQPSVHMPHELEVDEVYTILRKTRDLLTPTGSWTKGALGRRASGMPTSPLRSEVVARCSDGAVITASMNHSPAAGRRARVLLASQTFRVPLWGRLLMKLKLKLPGNVLAEFNDSDETQHQDVLRLIDKAIANA